jgi:hypothetical protein
MQNGAIMSRWSILALIAVGFVLAPQPALAQSQLLFGVKVVSVASVLGPCVPGATQFFFEYPFGYMSYEQCSASYVVGDVIRLRDTNGTYTEMNVASLPLGFSVLSASVNIGGFRQGPCTTYAAGQCGIDNFASYPVGTTIQNIVGDVIGGGG